MEKEIKYVAPQAEVLSAEIEKGFQGSQEDGDSPLIPGLDA